MVVCVLPRQYAADPPPWIFQSDIERLLIASGGKERGDSVYNGLDDLPEESAVTLVHDAARPFVDDATIDRVVAAARAGNAAVPGLPVVDTLKETSPDGRVIRTVPRDNLWRAQTPQGFPRTLLEDVYVRARRERISATDDAALCEHFGVPVVVVPGSERLMKITDESDFARAEAMFMTESAR
jgi:2-C-methyl-D-erythritol 4-phosphate cytidylyltransferase